ncbi:acetylhydrolase [Tritrichomonas foetus]|uniref:Acetylhydrolase n=1 Tax=Tritrichomonas foetus TaxID=1144522 RepID=A0A1J4KRX3_9EUKA|nr:acetylhydrolase [Tritrichomonas foetus]|eukprot:OHT13640.1 acetylhydrolase [Tritrichomonas foetus]
MIFVFLNFVLSTQSYDPLDAPFPVIHNQGFESELSKTYVRLPDRAHGVVRDPLWDLSRDSAGLYVSFKTNSNDIVVSYKFAYAKSMAHMASTGVSGVDLLAKDEGDGKWYSVLSSFSFGSNSATYYFKGIKEGEFEFRLYLPLYNCVSDFLITVNDGSSFEWIRKDTRTPIIAYGTSILQGACASRPISSWTNILQRRLDYPLINFGFSGNGKLEPEVIDFIIENEAKLYILDCLANLGGYSYATIKDLFYNAVKQIHQKWPNVPILGVDHAGYSYEDMVSSTHDEVVKCNTAQKAAFDQLVAEGEKNIYYFTKEEIGLDYESFTDYVHPNNYGMQKYAQSYERKIREILGDSF